LQNYFYAAFVQRDSCKVMRATAYSCKAMQGCAVACTNAAR